MKVLIAEDEAVSRRKMEFTLEKWGYEVEAVSDGAQALEKLVGENAPYLGILDVIMPEMNGVEVCRRVRQLNYIIPPYLILLTVKNNEKDVVRGLQSGANDYITKPFNMDELRARLQIGLKMVKLQSDLAKRINELEEALSRTRKLQGLLKKDLNVYKFGNFVLNPVERLLLRNGRPVVLTAKVFDLLLILVQNSGHLVHKDELIRDIWPDCIIEENNLTVNMSMLRKALGESRGGKKFIETVPGSGYRFISLEYEARPKIGD